MAYFNAKSKVLKIISAKNAGFAFFLGAIIVLSGEVFSSLAKLRTFFNLWETAP